MNQYQFNDQEYHIQHFLDTDTMKAVQNQFQVQENGGNQHKNQKQTPEASTISNNIPKSLQFYEFRKDSNPEKFPNNLQGHKLKQEELSSYNLQMEARNIPHFQGLNSTNLSYFGLENSLGYHDLFQPHSLIENWNIIENSNQAKKEPNQKNIQTSFKNMFDCGLLPNKIENQDDNSQSYQNYDDDKKMGSSSRIFQSFPMTNQQQSKGLRNLSLKVKQIVEQKKCTNYKEVADILIQEMKENDFSNDDLIKDEQNIKRRVYDALNVLIASDIIQKQGKKVLCRKCLDNQKWQREKYLRKELETKRLLFQEKKQILKDSLERALAINNLIKINRMKQQQKIDPDSLYPTTSQQQEFSNFEQITQGPAQIKSEMSHKNNEMVVKINKDKTNLKIYCRDQFNLYGDMDILIKLGLQNIPDEQAQEILKNQLGSPNLFEYYNKLQGEQIKL